MILAYFGETKIKNLGGAALGDEEVGGLDVAVDDIFGVSGVESVGNFDGKCKERVEFHGAAGDAMLERGALQKFHSDEGLAVLFADIVDGADVGVIERRGGLSFPFKTGEGLGIFGDVVGEEFQSDKATKACVFGFVDNAHASAAEFFQNAVMREGLADERRGIRHRTLILGLERRRVNTAKESGCGGVAAGRPMVTSGTRAFPIDTLYVGPYHPYREPIGGMHCSLNRQAFCKGHWTC